MRNIYAFFLFDDQGTIKLFTKPNGTKNLLTSKDATAIILYDDASNRFILVSTRDAVLSKDTVQSLNALAYNVVPVHTKEKILEKFKLFDFDDPIADFSFKSNDTKNTLLNRYETTLTDDIKVINPFTAAVFERILSKDECAAFDAVFQLDNVTATSKTVVETKSGQVNIVQIDLDPITIHSSTSILTKLLYGPFAVLSGIDISSDTKNVLASLDYAGIVNMKYIAYWEPDTLDVLEPKALDQFI